MSFSDSFADFRQRLFVFLCSLCYARLFAGFPLLTRFACPYASVHAAPFVAPPTQHPFIIFCACAARRNVPAHTFRIYKAAGSARRFILRTLIFCIPYLLIKHTPEMFFKPALKSGRMLPSRLRLVIGLFSAFSGSQCHYNAGQHHRAAHSAYNRPRRAGIICTLRR